MFNIRYVRVLSRLGLCFLMVFLGWAFGLQSCKSKGADSIKQNTAPKKTAKLKRDDKKAEGKDVLNPAAGSIQRFTKPLPRSEQAAEQETIKLMAFIQGLHQGIQKKKGLLHSMKERKKVCSSICQAAGGICKANMRICLIAKRFPHKKMLQKACDNSKNDCRGAEKTCTFCKSKSKKKLPGDDSSPVGNRPHPAKRRNP